MITFRKATCRDAARISKLLIHKYSFPDEISAKNTYKQECLYQHFRIAKQNNRIVGCISWKPLGLPKHGVVELTRIMVDPKVSNAEEVKELLFDQCVAEASYYYSNQGSRLRKIFSLIHADDTQIKEFFLRKGMLQEATLQSHFHAGKDELVLSLFIA